MTSMSAWIFVVQPPRERPIACALAPLAAERGALGFDVGAVDRRAARRRAGVDQGVQ